MKNVLQIAAILAMTLVGATARAQDSTDDGGDTPRDVPVCVAAA